MEQILGLLARLRLQADQYNCQTDSEELLKGYLPLNLIIFQ
jgi:hypothetical protein